MYLHSESNPFTVGMWSPTQQASGWPNRDFHQSPHGFSSALHSLGSGSICFPGAAWASPPASVGTLNLAPGTGSQPTWQLKGWVNNLLFCIWPVCLHTACYMRSKTPQHQPQSSHLVSRRGWFFHQKLAEIVLGEMWVLPLLWPFFSCNASMQRLATLL